MLLTVLIVSLLYGVSKGNVLVKCNEDSSPSFSYQASKEVFGRYTIEWCTESDENVTNWEVTLRYDENRSEERCQKYDIMFRGAVHSKFNKKVSLDINCTNVCYTTTLDLLFSGACYHIKTWLHRGRESSNPRDYVFYIKDGLKKESFTHSKARADVQSNGENMTIHWYLSYVPATDYTMELCSYNNVTDIQKCKNITQQCRSQSRNEVVCVAREPYAAYALRLRHAAPWAASPLFDTVRDEEYRFEHSAERGAPATGRNGYVLWAMCGALAAVLLAAGVCAACERHTRRNKWKPPSDQTPQAPKRATPDRGRILLVYARDCDHFMRLAAALRTLLARATDYMVYDLYSMETWREAAGAGGEWLRLVLARPDTRLVLLASPALQHLHAATLADNLKLEAPLLGAGAVYGRPHAADALVSLALRVPAETAHLHRAYRKYYKATVSGLDVKVIPSVTPLRDYRLPEDALALLKDLDPSLFEDEGPCDRAEGPERGGGPSREILDPELRRELRELQDATEMFLAYVRDKPAYLAEELFFTGA